MKRSNKTNLPTRMRRPPQNLYSLHDVGRPARSSILAENRVRPMQCRCSLATMTAPITAVPSSGIPASSPYAKQNRGINALTSFAVFLGKRAPLACVALGCICGQAMAATSGKFQYTDNGSSITIKGYVINIGKDLQTRTDTPRNTY